MLEEVYVRDFSKVIWDKNIALGWKQQRELLKRSFVQLLLREGGPDAVFAWGFKGLVIGIWSGGSTIQGPKTASSCLLKYNRKKRVGTEVAPEGNQRRAIFSLSLWGNPALGETLINEGGVLIFCNIPKEGTGCLRKLPLQCYGSDGWEYLKPICLSAGHAVLLQKRRWHPRNLTREV